MSITSRSSQAGISSGSKVVGSVAGRRRASKRKYALAMAAAAVPGVFVAPHAFANINTTTTDGFDTAGWALPNGSATVINATTLELTQNVNSLAGSMWFNTPQDITNFSTSFTYTATNGSGNPADGVAFVIQNDPNGTLALGGGGGALGYTGINNSGAFEINIYAPNNRGVAANVNGATGGYATAPGIDWLGGPVDISLTYNGAYLKETVTQGTNVFTHLVGAPLAAVAGSNTALVGFTGATGGENATQQVSNFIFTEGGVATVTNRDFQWNDASNNFTNNASWNPNSGHPGDNPAFFDNAFIENNQNATVHLNTAISDTSGANIPMNALTLQNGNTLSIEPGASATFLGGFQMSTSIATNTLNVSGGNVEISGGISHFGQNGGTAKINISGGSLTVGANDWIGFGDGAGSSADIVQTGGTLSITNWFLLGRNGGSATYNLSSGTLNANRMSIGQDFSTGLFNMTGGTINVQGDSEIGHSGASAGFGGIFNMSGGTYNSNGIVMVGTWTDGDGTFNMTGGTINTNGGVWVARGDVNNNVSNRGTFNLSNGVINSNNDIAVGRGGPIDDQSDGTFNMTGGIINENQGWMRIGQDNAKGTFNMSGGTMNFTGQLNGTGDNRDTWLQVGTGGNNSTGVFNMSAGNINLGGDGTHGGAWLMVGQNGAHGTFNMSGGHIQGNNGDVLIGVDTGSVGVFNMTGGSIDHPTGNWFNVGRNGADGTFNVSGSATVNSENMWIGISEDGGQPAATGTFNVSNGANVNIHSDTHIGRNEGSVGTLNITGGFYLQGSEIGVGHWSPLIVGDRGGTGYMNLSGGTYRHPETDDIFGDGTSPGGVPSLGVLNMTGGTFSHESGNWVRVGSNGGQGIFNLSGGTMNTTNLMIGPSDGGQGATGTVNVMPGALINDSGDINVGMMGRNDHDGENLPVNGFYNQTGGTLNMTGGWLSVGVHQDATGVFNFSGGTMTGGGLLIGRESGKGIGNISAGTLSFPGGPLIIAQGGQNTNGVSSSGVLTQTGGDITTSWAQLGDGGTNVATYNMSGGTLTTVNEVNVGRNGSEGVFNMTGGTITASTANNNDFNVGRGGKGTLNISNGTINAVRAVFVGNGEGGRDSIGTVNQSGGVVSSGAWFSIGADDAVARPNSVGIYNLTGGTVNAGTELNVGDATNGHGIFNVSGANSVVNAPNLLIGKNDNATAVMNQTGGTVNVSNETRIGNNGAGSIASYNLSAGTLNGGAPMNVFKGGTFTQKGGVATVGAVTVVPTGSATVGGGANPAQFNFNGMTADNFTINDKGTATQKVPNGPIPPSRDNSATNTVGALSINGATGLLDMGNRDLVLDNTRTLYSTSRGYWNTGYNNDPGSGFGVWDGKKGLTSSVAKASAQVDGKITIGYLDGAAQADFGGSYADLIGGPVMTNTQTLFRPTLMGDLNLDGFCNGDDIGIIISLGYYGTGTAPHGWLDGDLNGDGVVDGNDIGLIISTGSYNATHYGASKGVAKAAASSLSGGDSVAANTIEGHLLDGKFDFVYDPNTGDIKIDYDGDPNITGGKPLQRLKLASLGGRFITSAFNGSGFGTATSTNTLIDAAQAQGSIPDHYDLGNVLPAGLDTQTLLNDLTLNWQVLNGGLGVRNGDVVVPEPSALALVGIGAMGLLARRRKAKAAK